jgi:hypothetical protein
MNETLKNVKINSNLNFTFFFVSSLADSMKNHQTKFSSNIFQEIPTFNDLGRNRSRLKHTHMIDLLYINIFCIMPSFTYLSQSVQLKRYEK